VQFRLPKPFSDQFPVRVCSCLLCIINRLRINSFHIIHIPRPTSEAGGGGGNRAARLCASCRPGCRAGGRSGGREIRTLSAGPTVWHGSNSECVVWHGSNSECVVWQESNSECVLGEGTRYTRGGGVGLVVGQEVEVAVEKLARFQQDLRSDIGSTYWPLKDIFFLRGFCARITHPFIAHSHLHWPH